MIISSISDAKNRLSALLDRVRAGESVLIVDRGRPVARLIPATSHADAEGRLARLERAGIVRLGAAKPSLREITSAKPPQPRPGANVVAALIDDRRKDR